MTQLTSETPGARDGNPRRDIARAAVVALLAGLVYLLSSGAHAYSVDEITNYASARALVETGSPDLAGEQPFPREQLLTLSHPSADRITGRYGLLSWAAMIPAYRLASWIGSEPPPPSSAFPQPSAVRPLAVLLYGPTVAAALVGATFSSWAQPRPATALRRGRGSDVGLCQSTVGLREGPCQYPTSRPAGRAGITLDCSP